MCQSQNPTPCLTRCQAEFFLILATPSPTFLNLLLRKMASSCPHPRKEWKTNNYLSLGLPMGGCVLKGRTDTSRGDMAETRCGWPFTEIKSGRVTSRSLSYLALRDISSLSSFLCRAQPRNPKTEPEDVRGLMATGQVARGQVHCASDELRRIPPNTL